jgi:hypothetical protein
MERSPGAAARGKGGIWRRISPCLLLVVGSPLRGLSIGGSPACSSRSLGLYHHPSRDARVCREKTQRNQQGRNGGREVKERCVLTSGMRRRRGPVSSCRSSEESPVTAVAHLHPGVHLSGEHGERTGGPTTDPGAASAGWSSGERDIGKDPATSGDMRWWRRPASCRLR